ncbi:MAG: ATP-binding protein [Microcoleaceae cyanobacterium]
MIFFHCNFRSLREEIAQKLQEDVTLELTELNLPYSCQTLYGAIADFINPDHPPKALIISGLELVKDLKRVLTSANKARDQFRQDFSFPIVLWVTDKILYHLGRIANDLNTWAGASICFELSPEQLISLLRQEAHKAFSNNLNLTGKHFDELEYIYQGLQKLEPQLTPEEKAIFIFLYGLVNYQKNKLDAAIDNYHTSLNFWQENNRGFEAGIICVKIAKAYDKKAEELRARNQEFWQESKKYLQLSLAYFESINNQDLVASAISQLGIFLRRLQAWDDLENLGKKGLGLHFNYNGTTLQLPQSYGFLAEVALHKQAWEKVEELAQLALAILNIFEAPEKEKGLYLLLLAQSQTHLNQVEKAILNLETAKKITEPQDHVELYLSILAELKTLYFTEKQYLKAFNIKLEQQKIKSKFRLQAFIGVGRLQPPEQFLHPGLEVWEKTDEILEDIVTASGRSQDVKNLLERVTRPDCKLTIIYGQSGVGKSSLVQAGLVPALKLISVESRDVIPVLVQSYHDWLQDSSLALIQVIQEVIGVNLAVNIQSGNDLIEEFKKNEHRNFYTVLIFDQFEEFFFAHKDLGDLSLFYQFFSAILQIPYLKVILSLREDYLHYLLDCNRKINLSAIDNDILNKKNLYYIGNFAKIDAKKLIKTLTERSQVYLEPALVDQLIEDLGGIVEEVRPIELQIVGTQLEVNKIFTLKDYQQLGNNAKDKLVENFLKEVIYDCGEENKEIAELILYLLTDENNTRPLKTKEELTEIGGIICRNSI